MKVYIIIITIIFGVLLGRLTWKYSDNANGGIFEILKPVDPCAVTIGKNKISRLWYACATLILEGAPEDNEMCIEFNRMYNDCGYGDQ